MIVANSSETCGCTSARRSSDTSPFEMFPKRSSYTSNSNAYMRTVQFTFVSYLHKSFIVLNAMEKISLLVRSFRIEILRSKWAGRKGSSIDAILSFLSKFYNFWKRFLSLKKNALFNYLLLWFETYVWFETNSQRDTRVMITQSEEIRKALVVARFERRTANLHLA